MLMIHLSFFELLITIYSKHPLLANSCEQVLNEFYLHTCSNTPSSKFGIPLDLLCVLVVYAREKT